MKLCPNCNELLGNNSTICFNCRYNFSLARVVTKDEIIKGKEEQKKRREYQEKIEQEAAKLRNIPFIFTTGYNFEGYTIHQYIGVVTSEYVIGTGFLSEMSATISDTFGVHSIEMEGKLAIAKKEALKMLQKKSTNAGANSLIGLRFNVLTLGANMIVVSAYGTAIVRKEIST